MTWLELSEVWVKKRNYSRNFTGVRYNAQILIFVIHELGRAVKVEEDNESVPVLESMEVQSQRRNSTITSCRQIPLLITCNQQLYLLPCNGMYVCMSPINLHYFWAKIKLFR